MRKKLAAAFASTALFIGLCTGSAFAWTYALTGSGECQDNGSFKITWTVNNSESEALHITASSNTSVVPVDTEVAAGSSQSFYQTVSGTEAGSFDLSLTGNFASDQTLRVREANVKLDTPCTQPGGQGGGCDTNSDSEDCTPPTKDCDNDYDNSPASECGGMGGGTVTPPTTPTIGGQGGGNVTTAASVTTTPTGGVNAGGGKKSINTSSIAGLIASIGSLGVGLGLIRKNSF